MKRAGSAGHNVSGKMLIVFRYLWVHCKQRKIYTSSKSFLTPQQIKKMETDKSNKLGWNTMWMNFFFPLHNSMKMSKLNNCNFFRHIFPTPFPLLWDSMYEKFPMPFLLLLFCYGLRVANKLLVASALTCRWRLKGSKHLLRLIRDAALQPIAKKTPDGKQSPPQHLQKSYDKAVACVWEAETAMISFHPQNSPN